MGMPTLLDIVKRNGTDAAVGLIEEASKGTPEIAGVNAARTIRGLNYKVRVRTAVPASAFRNPNEGSAVVKSTFEQRLIECYLLNPQFEVDKAVADASEDGAAAYLAEEAAGIMQGAMQALGKCFFYGNDATYGDAKGFPGCLQAYDSTNMEVTAGGTTASICSSVWLVRWGIQAVQWVMGLGGEVRVTDPIEARLDDGTNPFTGYRQELYARPGVQFGHIKSICRIKKVTTDSGKTLTDDLIFEALGKFPIGLGPNAIYMSPRSLYQLQASRTATNATGAPALIPTEIIGAAGPIPILPTESISDVEELTT